MSRLSVLTKKAFQYLPYIPRVITRIKNPFTYFKGYFEKQGRTIFLRNGLFLYTDNPDDISSISTILIKDEYDLNSVEDNKERVIVDIGANKGYFTALAAKNNLHKVFAYEPIPETFNKLKKNITDNNLTNVTLFNAGVAGVAEDRKFSFSEDKSILSSMVFAIGENSIIVTCTTLEKIFSDNQISKIDLLKLDCEGAEFETIYQSSDETLSKISTLKMEYHNEEGDSHNNIERLSEFLLAKGFVRTLHEPANQSLGISWFQRS